MMIFPKRRSQEGFVIKNRGGVGICPIWPRSVPKPLAAAAAIIPTDLTPFKGVLRSSTPLDGPFWGAPPAEGLSEIHKEMGGGDDVGSWTTKLFRDVHFALSVRV